MSLMENTEVVNVLSSRVQETPFGSSARVSVLTGGKCSTMEQMEANITAG